MYQRGWQWGLIQGTGDLPQLALAGLAIPRSREKDIPTELVRLERLHAIVDDERLGVVRVLAVELVVLVVGEAGVNLVLVEATAATPAADIVCHTRRALARGGDLKEGGSGRGHRKLEGNHVGDFGGK